MRKLTIKSPHLVATAIVPPIMAPARAPIEMAAGTGAVSTTTTGAGGEGGGQG